MSDSGEKENISKVSFSYDKMEAEIYNASFDSVFDNAFRADSDFDYFYEF